MAQELTAQGSPLPQSGDPAATIAASARRVRAHHETTMRFPCAIALFLPSLALAQEPTPQLSPDRIVRGAFGLDLTNQYFFRGMQQENQGFIAQPWVELGYALTSGDESLRALDLKFGLWNSLHDGPTGGTGGIWYESDFYIDLTAGLGERLRLGTRYTAYTSPNGTFDPVRRRGFRTTVEELAFTAGYDDKGLLLDSIDSGLRPHATIAFELDGQRDNGNDRGIYGELGIAPTFALGQFGSFDVTLEVPVTMGLSLGHYYEDQSGGGDETFGYLDVGAVLSAPLTFLPARVGGWQGELGLHWLLLGNNLEERNDGDTSELILSLGVGTTF